MRKTKQERTTKETQVLVEWNLDGEGNSTIETGIPFFDHMLELFAFHGRFDLKVQATGDLDVDDHHTVEDVGIVMGDALAEILQENTAYARYGFWFMPMDEVMARVVLDLSGRTWLHYNVDLQREKIGTLSTENVREFFSAFSRRAQITLHIDVLTPGNEHHQVEAIFKGFGRALKQATQKTEGEIASTKGVL